LAKDRPTILERLVNTLFPPMSADIVRLRTRVAYFALPIYYFLLVLWLVEGVTLGRFAANLGYEASFALISIGILAMAGILTLWLVHAGRIATAGHLLGIAFFGFAVIQAFDLPQSTSLMSFGFYASIMSVGAIVGGLSVYYYAVAAVLAMIGTWAQKPQLLTDPLNQATGIPFLVSQGALFLALAALLHFLSIQIVNTLSQMRNQADEMEQLALTDPLTDLSNRRHLLNRLEHEFSRSRRYHRALTLIFIDLDEFKAVNDRFGHMVGDDVLKGIAQSLRASIRSTDLLARVGGDEFAVLLPETTPDGGIKVINRLRESLLQYSTDASPSLPPLTFCAGVAQLSAEDESIDDLLARADRLQYLAKNAGKNSTITEKDLPEGEGILEPSDATSA
jgi:diguanylate cyclase (GGDEF)-like protein